VVARPCEVTWELDFSMVLVCMAPLWLRGLRGKKSTPSIGWEVLVRSQWLASSSGMKNECETNTSNSTPSVTVRVLNLHRK
jgi:hypothetical protein